VNASKENAKNALERLMKISDAMSQEFRTSHSSDLIFIDEFLLVAARKLPREESSNKDHQRSAK
jgi:hypothetical protein